MHALVLLLLSIADLQKLVGDGAYAEAIDHLGDIAPAQRDAKWIDVGGRAAAGALGAARDEIALALIDVIDTAYPQLIKSPVYAKPRIERGKTGLAACFADVYEGRACLAAGMRFVDASKDPAVTLAVAKIVRRSHDSAESLSLFVRVAGPSTCKDEDLVVAVVAGLDHKPDSKIATDARSVMTTCWDAVKDQVVKTFDEATKGSYVYQNACDTLVAKRLLSPLQAKRCAK
jgi:hypothetical protein